MKLFAIGDIHGCRAELQALLSHLTMHEIVSTEDRVIFMGDYVDRGSDSKGVIELLLNFRARFPNTIFLKGNHEGMMLSYLGLPGGIEGVSFLKNGGDKTLESYGIDSNDIPPVEAVLEKIPPSHIKFLQTLSRFFIDERFMFVHAGVNPERSLLDQSDLDLFWIRDKFVEKPHSFNKTIVFGHTPFFEIFIDPSQKIGIDTGLVFGNKLTCIEFTENFVFQVKAGEREVVSYQASLS